MIVSTWREQQPAGLRELHRAPAAAAVEQPHAERGLEAHHVLADRRLRVVERVGGPVERPLVRDGAEAQELAEAEVRERVREDAPPSTGRGDEVISCHDYLLRPHPIAVINPSAQDIAHGTPHRRPAPGHLSACSPRWPASTPATPTRGSSPAPGHYAASLATGSGVRSSGRRRRRRPSIVARPWVARLTTRTVWVELVAQVFAKTIRRELPAVRIHRRGRAGRPRRPWPGRTRRRPAPPSRWTDR